MQSKKASIVLQIGHGPMLLTQSSRLWNGVKQSARALQHAMPFLTVHRWIRNASCALRVLLLSLLMQIGSPTGWTNAIGSAILTDMGTWQMHLVKAILLRQNDIGWATGRRKEEIALAGLIAQFLLGPTELAL